MAALARSRPALRRSTRRAGRSRRNCSRRASRDALGDSGAGSRALERALELAEPDGLLLPFLLHPAPELLERQSRFRSAHASLISEILNVLSGHKPTAGTEDAEPLKEPLSESELRVLRYLPTNLQAPEIAAELFVSLNTSALTCETRTPSSACTAAQTRSSGRASSASCHPQRADADGGRGRPRAAAGSRADPRVWVPQPSLEFADRFGVHGSRSLLLVERRDVDSEPRSLLTCRRATPSPVAVGQSRRWSRATAACRPNSHQRCEAHSHCGGGACNTSARTTKVRFH